MAITTKRWASLGTLAIAAALAAGACNSGSPSTAPASAAAATQAPAAVATTAATQAPASQAAAGDLKGANIFVVGGKPDDPFWSKVKKGVDDQAKVVEAYGGKVTWLAPQNYDNLGPDAAKLIQTALSQNPSGIIGPDWVPEAEDPAFQAVVAAGVPLIIYNAGGMDAATKLGALNYVGNDEYAAGLGGGEYLGTNGVKHVLCVNTLPGTANIEARCKGLADGIAKSGGKSTDLPLPSSQFSDQTAVAQAVKASLAKDPTIDAAMTVVGRRRDQLRPAASSRRARGQGEARLVRLRPDRAGPHQGRHADDGHRPAALSPGFAGHGAHERRTSCSATICRPGPWAPAPASSTRATSDVVIAGALAGAR